MIFKFNHKNFQISDSSYGYIEKHLEKLFRQLTSFGDQVILRLVIRKNVKPVPAFFEGTVNLHLNSTVLNARFKGQTVEECIDNAFGLIFKKLGKYKGTHFQSSSKYPDHATIRYG